MAPRRRNLKTIIIKLIAWLVSMAASSAIIFALGGGVAFIRRPVGAIYLTLWVMWGLVTALGRQRGVASLHDKSQRAFTVLGGPIMLALIVVAPWEYANFTGPIARDGLLAWIGLALFAVGDGLQAAAMWALHGLYTSRLGVQPGHRLVTNGPYRLVRHPGYLGATFCLTGMGLALSSLIAIGLSILFVPVLLWRIKREEEMLLTEFDEDYGTYMRKTKRLIPLIY